MITQSKNLTLNSNPLPEFEIGQPVPGATYFYRFETVVIIETNIKRPIVNNYTRRVEIIYLGELKSCRIFQLLCTETDFAGKGLHSAPLLRKISYVFDELVIAVNTKGEIVEIENRVALQSKWENTKINLLKDNEGVEVDDYFKSIDLVLYDKQKLIGFLSEKNMYGLYFNGYWGKCQDLISQPERLDNIRKEKIEVYNSDTDEEIVLYTSLTDSEGFYKGEFHYQKDHQLMEAVLEMKELHNHIKYNVLCLGLKEL